MGFEVVGEDGEVYYVEGDVMGDVMGAAPRGRRLARPGPRHAAVPVNRPQWRDTQVAPGVIAPDQGVVPLPLSGANGVNTFSTTVTQITFTGQVQKPFRPERLLVTVARTGTSAVGRLLGQIFVGVNLQAADVTSFDLEQYGAPTAFGVRLTMQPLQPGVLVKIPTVLSSALAGTDTIFCSVSIAGRIIQ